jgi:hypothetical protein
MNENQSLSPEGGALMMDAPYRADSQDFAQYTLQGMRKYRINLRSNRTSGEFFPQFEGKYFFVESCDVPCNIQIGSGTGNEFYGADGYVFRGPFKGLTLTHVDYSAIASTVPLSLVFYVCDSDNFFQQNYVAPARIGMPLTTFTQTGVNGYGLIRWPIPDGSRTISKLAGCALVTLTAAIVGDFTCELSFLIAPSGSPILVPPATYYGTGYTATARNSMRQIMRSGVYNAAAFQYWQEFSFENLPIPSFAREVEVRMYANGVNNLAAVASYTGTGTGGNAVCWVA